MPAQARLHLAIFILIVAFGVAAVLSPSEASQERQERPEHRVAANSDEAPLRASEPPIVEVWEGPATTTTTAAPPPPPTTTTTAPPSPPTTEHQHEVAAAVSAVGDPYSDAAWDQLAGCESGGDWSANTGNGYYGGIQFSLSSWAAVGGTGLPSEHSRSEQIARGRLLWEQGGWAHWPACTAKFGWR